MSDERSQAIQALRKVADELAVSDPFRYGRQELGEFDR
jgi:hypothetical protein